MLLPQGWRHDESSQLLVENLSTAVPKHLFCRRVEFEDSSLQVHGDDGIQCSLQDRSFAYLTGLHRLLCPLLLGNISQNNQATNEVTAVVPEVLDPQIKGKRYPLYLQHAL